ncbi:MAG: hypothetical protein IKB95_02295 [Bacteroidales bacterium]|nr:hypothetical protein [Bacteroidales bacterium]
MKSGFHFTVKLKLILSFGVLGALMLATYYLHSSSQQKSSELLNNNISVVYPSMLFTENYKDLIEQTNSLLVKWTLLSDSLPAAKKISNEIDACHGIQLDSLNKQILNFVQHDLWGDAERDLYYATAEKTDSLFYIHEEYMDNLLNAKSNNDLETVKSLRNELIEGRIAEMHRTVLFQTTKLANMFYRLSSQNLAQIEDNIDNSLDR